MPDNESNEDGQDMPGAPHWMATYGDMMTLLLTFFVLMFAMSSIDVEKFEAAAASLAGALGILGTDIGIEGDQALPSSVGRAEIASDPDMLTSFHEIVAAFQTQALENLASIEISGPGEIHITLGSQVLFDPGESDLKPQARQILTSVTNSVKGNVENVYVEGHTDNVPISTLRYPSNWELSAARALSVVRLMADLGIPPERLAAVGHGEHIPLHDNVTAEERAMNRRVELYLTWGRASDE